MAGEHWRNRSHPVKAVNLEPGPAAAFDMKPWRPYVFRGKPGLTAEEIATDAYADRAARAFAADAAGRCRACQQRYTSSYHRTVCIPGAQR